ncbi:MAG TPA: hypothetical protein VMG12_43245 [Polyangiaceae bacterium]|nr:hypothetical protein [Polyangiaceae bacterium]
MSTTPKATARRRHARVGLLGIVAAFAMSRCMSFSGGCEPGDCAPGYACAMDGGCALQAGSCGSNADCAEGEHCVTYTTGGEFLASRDSKRCERGPGDVGEPCGASLLEPCLAGATCVWQTHIEFYPVVDDVGNGYWLEPGEPFNYSSQLTDSLCVANGSLGVGEFCNEAVGCAPDLICHRGYTPNQCRPRSELGEPCLRSGECVEGRCVQPVDLGRPPDCAIADPRCDIREDASCGYWMSCGQCVAQGG